MLLSTSLWLAWRVADVWEGKRTSFLPLELPAFTVTHRGLPTFAAAALLLSTATVLVAVDSLTTAGDSIPAGSLRSLVLALLGCSAMVGLLWASVEATNRPSAFVPPHLRGEPGWIAEWRERRRRGSRGGRPATDHPVQIIEVTPGGPDGTPGDWYVYAECEALDCNWMSPTFSRNEHLDPEQAARQEASGHSTNVAPDVERPLST